MAIKKLSHPARILIVDDDEFVQRALERRLDGYEITFATNGREAIEQCMKHTFDVVLCDIDMPEMNGIEFYYALAERQPALIDRIIFVSGSLSQLEARQFRRSVSNRFLPKPFRFETLKAAIDEYL